MTQSTSESNYPAAVSSSTPEPASAPIPVRRAPPPDAYANLGNALIGIGTIGLLVGALMSRATSGGVAAAAVFTVIMGLCIRNPTLLQDGSVTDDNRPNYSSMRVVMLLIVTTFTVLTIKLGWSATSLESLKIDDSWVWVLVAALTGKIGQSAAESLAGKKS